MMNKGTQFYIIAVLAVGQTLSDVPNSGKPTSATSYSVYHRKFEPKDGPSKSVHYSTKIGPKFSSKTSHPLGPGLKKGAKFTSKEAFSDRPTFQDNSDNKGGFLGDIPSNFNDRPPPQSSNFNDGAAYSNESPATYNSGEVELNQRTGTNFDAPYNDSPAYTPPYTNDAPPVYNDVPNYTPDIPYNGPNRYVPPPPPASLPHYDSGPIVSPQQHQFDYPAPPIVHQPFHASQPNYQSNFPINIPNLNQPQFPINIPSVQQSHFPINIPGIQQSHYPIPGVQQSHFPVNIPGGQSYFSPVNVIKPSFQIPYANSPGLQFPGQYNTYQFDSGSHHFPAPPKVFSPIPYQQPIYQGSSKIETVSKPDRHKTTSYHGKHKR